MKPTKEDFIKIGFKEYNEIYLTKGRFEILLKDDNWVLSSRGEANSWHPEQGVLSVSAKICVINNIEELNSLYFLNE